MTSEPGLTARLLELDGAGAGDTVIDGSVAGRLQNLTSYLTR